MRSALTLIELPVRRGGSKHGFTLIELLVVVTIIVVLLALLVPAMDQAVYQAELAKCGVKQRAVGSAAVTRAFDYQRRYPERTGMLSPHNVQHVHPTVGGDNRPALRKYLGDNLNQMLQDPFCVPVDLDGSAATSNTFSSYWLWFGWRFNGAPGMGRVGDRWVWNGKRYRLLIQDFDVVQAPNNEWSSHPDADGFLVAQPTQDKLIGNSYWTHSTFNGAALQRGLIDMNVTYDDLSVARLDRIAAFDSRIPIDDERLDQISNNRNGAMVQVGIVPRN